MIVDVFKAKGFHTYQQYFHFAPTGKITISANNAQFDDGIVKANMHFVTPNAKIKRKTLIYSSNYNAICKNDCIKSSFSALGNTSAITVIYGNTAENFVPYDVSFEQIKTARSERHCLFPRHRAL